MSFELPKLNYKYDELEPYIDSKTMEIHHSKHHAGYTNNGYQRNVLKKTENYELVLMFSVGEDSLTNQTIEKFKSVITELDSRWQWYYFEPWDH